MLSIIEHLITMRLNGKAILHQYIMSSIFNFYFATTSFPPRYIVRFGPPQHNYAGQLARCVSHVGAGIDHRWPSVAAQVLPACPASFMMSRKEPNSDRRPAGARAVGARAAPYVARFSWQILAALGLQENSIQTDGPHVH